MTELFQGVCDECPRCQARKKFPKELKHFTSLTNPSNPGEIFVSDVIKRAKQLIFISRDSFSDFVTTSFIISEKAEDLKEGIITTTSTIRRQSEITVRVDSAPGFLSLAKKDEDMKKLKIKLEISDPNNKNGLAIVDKAIQELEKELKAVSPEGKTLSSSQLAEATMKLNTRIRNRNLSSREIIFSREQFSGENLDLKDEELKTEKMTNKIVNHKYSEKSKYPKFIEPLDAKACKGDAVYLKDDGGKHTLRDKYVVLDVDKDGVKLAKLLHAMNRDVPTKLSSKTIKMKQTEIYKCDPEETLEYLPVYDEVEKKEENYMEPEIVNDPTPSWSVFPSSSQKTAKHQWNPISTDRESSGDDDSSEDSSHEVQSNTEDSQDDRITIDDSDPDARNFGEENARDDDDNSNDSHSETENLEANHLNIRSDLTENSNHDESSITITETADSVESEHNDQETGNLYDWNISNPTELPNKGDKIEYLDDKNGPPAVIRRAMVTKMFRTVQQKNPGWVNIINEGAHKQSSIKINDYKWRILQDESDIREDSKQTDNDQEKDTEVREAAFHEEVPLHDHLAMPFNEVLNMENILPLTSTPTSSNVPNAHFPQRTSSVRPRGLLPMEFEDSPLGSTSKNPSRYWKALADRA